MSSGGAERVITNLANEFSKRGDLKVYLATRFEGVNTKLVSNLVKVVDLRTMNFFRFYRFLRNLSPDVLMSTSSSNLRAAALKIFLPDKTLFITRAANIFFNWRSPLVSKGLKSKIAAIWLRFAYNHSDGIISNSPDTEKSLIDEGIRNSIKTIGNPVFYAADINQNAMVPHDVITPYIVYVGSYKSQKRIDLLLDVFLKLSQMADINLVMVGDGVDSGVKEFAISFIRDHNLQHKVLMVGRKSDLSGYYKHARCFVLCSEYEGFGNVIVESLAYGTPVVCFDCPGGPNFILEDNKYGQLVEFGDTDAFAQKVFDIITNKIEYKDSDLISRAQIFSVESISEQYLECIKHFYYDKFSVGF